LDAPYRVQLGIIGGSGLYHMEGVEELRRHAIDTPFGAPSDDVIEFGLGDKVFYFIPRHGSDHTLTPSEVNYRANVYALKSLGVTHLLGINACGIMTEAIRPGDVVIPDQIIDRTKGLRPSSFFGGGIVGHVGFADPFSGELRRLLIRAAHEESQGVHDSGCYVCMEGPQFSTRAESAYYRQTMNPTLIGMTALPEAKLAREAEMAYAILALATDYDCWHESEADVSVGAVIEVVRANTALANAIVRRLLAILPAESQDPCLEAARHAIITAPHAIPGERRRALRLLYGRYFGDE